MSDESAHCKVLLVGPLPTPPLLGGIEVGVDILLRSELARENSIYLFNTWRAEDPTRSIWQRINYQITACYRLLIEIKRRKCSIVHIKTASGINFYQNALYAIIAYCLSRRVILQVHGGYFPQFYSSAKPVLKPIIRLALRVPHRLIVLSQSWMDYFEKFVDRRSIGVVPNATYTESYRQAKPDRKRFSIQEGRFAVLFMGTRDRVTEKSKGILELIAAAEILRGRHPELLLVIAGSGSHKQEMTCALGEEGGSWINIGVVAQELKPILYRSVDVFVLPSHFENMPNSLIEAMAAGLPVVATSVGAISEMIRDRRSGLLVSPEDTISLAAGIEALITDPGLRASLSVAAAETAAKKYDMAVLQSLLSEEYKKII